jgi:hypothetical protein
LASFGIILRRKRCCFIEWSVIRTQKGKEKGKMFADERDEERSRCSKDGLWMWASFKGPKRENFDLSSNPIWVVDLGTEHCFFYHFALEFEVFRHFLFSVCSACAKHTKLQISAISSFLYTPQVTYIGRIRGQNSLLLLPLLYHMQAAHQQQSRA